MNGTQILMHGNEKVLECKFDKRGYIQSIGTIYNEKHLPICMKKSPLLDLQRWLLARGLATNRKDIAPLREFYGGNYFISSNGISLFDTYWFANPGDEDWEKYNAYDNWVCQKDSLFLMLAYPQRLTTIDTNSPNLCIPGSKQRLWYRDKENIVLLHGDAKTEVDNYKKAGEGRYVAEKNYVILCSHIYAKSPSFTSKDIEQLSFEDLYYTTADDSKTEEENIKVCCEKYDINHWKDFFVQMKEYDEIIGNEDRTLNDIGILRDTKTLEIIGFAPL